MSEWNKKKGSCGGQESRSAFSVEELASKALRRTDTLKMPFNVTYYVAKMEVSEGRRRKNQSRKQKAKRRELAQLGLNQH